MIVALITRMQTGNRHIPTTVSCSASVQFAEPLATAQLEEEMLRRQGGSIRVTTQAWKADNFSTTSKSKHLTERRWAHYLL